MSYLPASKLSHSNGRATVLTGDNVMVTQGLGMGQMMKLQDWIILADGQTIYEDYVPLSKPDYATQNAASLSSVFRWSLNPQNYRVAVMTPKGLLQVKSVLNGEVERDDRGHCKKTLFVDEAAWRSSLPPGGTTELNGPKSNTLVVKGLTDAEKLKKIAEHYRMRNVVRACASPVELHNQLGGSIDKFREELSKISLDDDMNTNRRHKLTNALKRVVRCYKLSNDRIKLAGASADKNPLQICMKGTSTILATDAAGTRYYICYYNGKIAAVPTATHWRAATLYNNFAEMGNPKITVIYRKQTIDI